MIESIVMLFKMKSRGSRGYLYPNLKVQEVLEINYASSTPLKMETKREEGVFSPLVTKAKLTWNVLLIILPMKLNGVPLK